MRCDLVPWCALRLGATRAPAVFAERCVRVATHHGELGRLPRAGCRPGGTVLDPFTGSGTVGIAARQLGRKFAGIELNPDYCALARTRLLAGAGGEGD